MFSFWNGKNKKPTMTVEPPKETSTPPEIGEESDLPSTQLSNLSTTREAINKYREHLRVTAELYRQKLTEWQKMAIEMKEDHADLENHQAHHALLTSIGESFWKIGNSLFSLHHSLEPASVHLKHLVTTIHHEIHQTHLDFSEKLNALESTTDNEAQRLLKYEILCLGIAIWDGLAKLEVDVDALIGNCLSFQKNAEKAVNIAFMLTENLLLALLIASLGNYDELMKLKINHLCFKDAYDNYLLNTIDNGKKRIDLEEVQLGSLLAKGEDAVKRVQVVQAIVAEPVRARP